MLIRLALGQAPTLEAPEDLKRFKVVAPRDMDGVALHLALGEAGWHDDEDAWISPEWVKRASGHATDAAWLAEFQRMLDHAGKQGWVNEKGEIRAHIERE